MTRPQQEFEEEQRRRAEAAEADNRCVERFTAPIESVNRVIERGRAGGLALPHGFSTFSSGAGLLTNMAGLVTGTNAIVNGAPEDRALNSLRTTSSAVNAVRSGTELINSLAPSRQLERFSERADRVAAPVRALTTLADLQRNGPTEENVGDLTQQAVTTAAARLGLGATTGTAGLAYGATNMIGGVAHRAADGASVDEHMHPHQVVGRGANAATTTTYETGTDDATRQGLRDTAAFSGAHPTMAQIIGGIVRPDRLAEFALGGQLSNEEMQDSGATAVGALSAAGHGVANTARALPAAIANSTQRPQSNADIGALRALGVTPLSPYQIGQLPSYDEDHPPPRSH